MGARCRRLLPLFVLFTGGIVLAQEAAEKVLPDAPAPAHSAAIRSNTPIVERGPDFPSPLSARAKYALAYHKIVSLQMPVKATLIAGFEVAAGTGPDLPRDGWGPFGKRVGYNALGISTTTFFSTALVPSLVHQDPRYFPLREGSAWSRVCWVLRSQFVGFGDDGHPMPNYAALVGFALSSITANAYLPRSSTGWRNTVQSYGIKLGVSSGMNLAREFGVFDRVKAVAHRARKSGH